MSPYYCLVQVVSHCNNTHHEKFTLQHCVKFYRTWSFVFLIDTAEILSTMHFPCITAVLDIDTETKTTPIDTPYPRLNTKNPHVYIHTHRRKKVGIIGLGFFVIYTNDCFVLSDFSMIPPWIKGRNETIQKHHSPLAAFLTSRTVCPGMSPDVSSFWTPPQALFNL